jgi:hypothetical protein
MPVRLVEGNSALVDARIATATATGDVVIAS